DFTTTYTVGVNLDLKLGRSKKRIAVISGEEESYWFVRVRYAYNLPQYQKNYTGLSGDFHYLTIGIGGFGRKVSRKY
ncbi:MAG: hypothetical protein ACPF9D_02450, partial [Owenweeksia sp.]